MNAAPTTPVMLETAYAIETPEGVNLELSPAGLVVRWLAWSIDLLIRAVFYAAFGMVLPFLGGFGIGLFLLVMFLLEWFYPVLFEVYRRGQTPGKSAMGIRVLQDSGIPVGWTTSLIRNLLRVADFLPFLYGFGIVSMLLTKDFRRLGDLAAGTLVVYAEPPRETVSLPDVRAYPPPVSLRLLEQRAVLNFAERGPGLSTARAQELANLVKPLTHAQGQAAITQLYGIANWLQGRR